MCALAINEAACDIDMLTVARFLQVPIALLTTDSKVASILHSGVAWQSHAQPSGTLDSSIAALHIRCHMDDLLGATVLSSPNHRIDLLTLYTLCDIAATLILQQER
jgi:hypothetical protein